MIPNFRAFNKETKKMYSIDGFKASERKIYRCSFADDEFRSGRLETFHFVEDNLDDYQYEIDELQRDIDELDTRKDILVRKLQNLLESVEE